MANQLEGISGTRRKALTYLRLSVMFMSYTPDPPLLLVCARGSVFPELASSSPSSLYAHRELANVRCSGDLSAPHSRHREERPAIGVDEHGCIGDQDLHDARSYAGTTSR